MKIEQAIYNVRYGWKITSEENRKASADALVSEVVRLREFVTENSELCILIARREKELEILRDLLARLLCWPVLDDLREGERWKREITETLHLSAATLSERSNDAT